MRPVLSIRTAAALAAGLALGGCASWFQGAETANDLPAVMSGRKVTVVMRWAGDDPLPTAERYCAEVGGYPWPVSSKALRASYECVPSDRARRSDRVGPALGSRGQANP